MNARVQTSARGFSNGWLMAGRRRWQWRDDGAIPLSGHKISGHKSSTIRPPLIALVPVLRRGWYLVHDEIDCESLSQGRETKGPGVHASVSSAFAGFGILSHVTFFFFSAGGPPSITFLFSSLGRSLAQKPRSLRYPLNTSSIHVQNRNHIYKLSSYAIRYTFLGRFQRQLGTMHRAIKRNVRCSIRRGTIRGVWQCQ